MARDLTRKIEAAPGDMPPFLQRFSITLVVVEGGAEGTEHTIEQPRTILGRGSDADWIFHADAVSKLHAAIEVGATGVRVVDLDSTNGTYLNDSRIEQSDLKHGDQVQLGELVLQCLIEPRSREPRTFQIP